jgi:hypothetical protein
VGQARQSQNLNYYYTTRRYDDEKSSFDGDRHDDASGGTVMSKPFVGLEIANNSKMSFWGELGYVLGKYTIEATNLATGVKIEKDVSINGLHVTGGVKFRL